jgi:hypothetical protein
MTGQCKAGARVMEVAFKGVSSAMSDGKALREVIGDAMG